MSFAKVDNSDMVSKELIRNWLLAENGGAENTKVLELFGGEGHVFDACYADPPVKEHLAFDLRKVNRPTWLQGDNRTLLASHVKGWDLYDLDAYSSPWRLANDICRMREDGLFSFALTCGIYRTLNAGTIEPFINQRIGLNGCAWHVGIITRWYPNIISWLMKDWERWGVRVLKAKYVTSERNANVSYFAVMLEKDSSKATEAIVHNAVAAPLMSPKGVHSPYKYAKKPTKA